MKRIALLVLVIIATNLTGYSQGSMTNSTASATATNAPSVTVTNSVITIKETILEEHLLMGADLLSGSMGQPKIVLTLTNHPDVRFVVSSAIGFKSGLIPQDGLYDGAKICGWKVELTYYANSKYEISKVAHYDVVTLTVIDRTAPSPKTTQEKK